MSESAGSAATDSDWYEAARQQSLVDAGKLAAAKNWLGDSYLLARPINRRKQ